MKTVAILFAILTISIPCAAGTIISVNPNTFNFAVDPNGTNPDDQILTITNTGEGTLNWTITESCGWFTVTPDSGSSSGEADSVILSVDITGLTEGRYICDLTITDPCAMGSPQVVNVNLQIGALYVPSQYPTIQSAIDASMSGDAVVVADGVYTGVGNRNIQLRKDNITVRSENGPGNCIIDCEDMTRGFYIDANSVVEGFTITNGYASGGGIYIESGGPIISNCIIKDNESTWAGGGIYIRNGGTVINNCIIAYNESERGGGLLCLFGSLEINNCSIINNLANRYGGGVGSYFYDTDITITNCTIVGNSAGDGGGGLYRCDGAITNCIIWGNTAANGGDQLYLSSTPTYSCIQDWAGGGTGNINSDPLFADISSSDPNDWDLHLKSEEGRWNVNTESWVTDAVTSSCIDAGDPGSDWTGELWPDGGRINMGAYGGTSEASMSGNPVGSVADFNKDYSVDGLDLQMLADKWLLEEILLAEDINRNNFVDMVDVALFAQEWLIN